MGGAPYMLAKRGWVLFRVFPHSTPKEHQPTDLCLRKPSTSSSEQLASEQYHGPPHRLHCHHALTGVLCGGPGAVHLRLHRQANTHRHIDMDATHRDFLQVKFLTSDTHRTSQTFTNAPSHEAHEASTRVGAHCRKLGQKWGVGALLREYST